jgi:hypothetical protein
LNTALRKQIQCDSISRIVEDKKLSLSKIPNPTERGKVQKDITALEKQADDLQKQADAAYSQARDMEQQKMPQKSEYRAPAANNNKKQNAVITKDSNKMEEKKVYEYKPVIPKTEDAPGKDINTFEILPGTPYSSSNPIPVDQDLSKGIIYKIQLGVFSKAVSYDQFKGLKPITGETMPDGTVIKYYAGLFISYESAEKALRQVHDYGYKEAFMVAYYEGKKIPVNRAKQLENSNK